MEGDAELFFSSQDYMRTQFYSAVQPSGYAEALLIKLQRYANESIDSTNCGDWLRLGRFNDEFTRLNLAPALRAMGATEPFITQVYQTVNPAWEIPTAS